MNEKEERAYVRGASAAYNDWSESDDLVDVLENHLEKHLEERRK